MPVTVLNNHREHSWPVRFAARVGPLVCVIDDAHWLQRAGCSPIGLLRVVEEDVADGDPQVEADPAARKLCRAASSFAKVVVGAAFDGLAWLHSGHDVQDAVDVPVLDAGEPVALLVAGEASGAAVPFEYANRSLSAKRWMSPT